MDFITAIVVAKLGGLSGILGLDFLTKYDALINTSSRMLHSLYFGETCMVREDDLQCTCAIIRISETVNIPDKSEMLIKGKICGKFPYDNDSIIEPLHGEKIGKQNQL